MKQKKESRERSTQDIISIIGGAAEKLGLSIILTPEEYTCKKDKLRDEKDSLRKL